MKETSACADDSRLDRGGHPSRQCRHVAGRPDVQTNPRCGWQVDSDGAINVVGDDLHFWYPDMGSLELPSFVASHAQIFDDGTIERLRRFLLL